MTKPKFITTTHTILMTRFSLLVLAFFLFFSCNNQQTQKSGTLDLAGYQQKLSELNPELMESSGAALKLFTDEFIKDDPAQNELAMGAFMDFQFNLLESLNSSLYDNQDFTLSLEKLFYTVEGEENEPDPGVEEYLQTLKDNGLMLGSAEGAVYIESDPDIVNPVFMEYLPEGAKEYYRLLGVNLNSPIAEDAGIIIPIKDLAERTLAWENLTTTYPSLARLEDAKEVHKILLYFLMAGMDNTMPFDYETMEWHSEFLAAYQWIISTAPDSQSAKTLQELLDLLAETDNKQTEEIGKFIEEYSPWEDM